MNKMDLIAQVAEEADLPKSKAAQVVEAVFGAIGAALKQNEDVRLVGFGTFATAQRGPTQGHNPQTGQVISIPPSIALRFKPVKALRDLLN